MGLLERMGIICIIVYIKKPAMININIDSKIARWLCKILKSTIGWLEFDVLDLVFLYWRSKLMNSKIDAILIKSKIIWKSVEWNEKLVDPSSKLVITTKKSTEEILSVMIPPMSIPIRNFWFFL